MSVLESENVDIMSKKFFYEVWFSDAEKAEIEEPLIARGVEKGIEQGIEQGIERGREEGREEGIEQGREEGQRQTLMTAVHNMLQQGFDVATIAKCLSISEAEVQQIQAERP